MSKIDYQWHFKPPKEPDVYMTRRNASKYLTLRYWDGKGWFDINWSTSRGGRPFVWPKGSRTKRPAWAKDRDLVLREIHGETPINWGEPFRVYDEKEVLRYLVYKGCLADDWETRYQADMRAINFK